MLRGYGAAVQIWLCITVFYCYQYILRVLPGNIAPDLFSKYSVGASEYGAFVGSYYISYVAMQIPIGVLLSKYGSKKIIPLFMALTFAGLIPIAYSGNWYLAILGRTVTGAGAAAAAVGGFQIFRVVFKEGFGRALGLMLSVSLVSLTPVIKFFNSLEFKPGIETLILVGAILTFVTFFALPKDKKNDYAEEKTWDLLKHVLSHRKILFVSILSGLMICPLEGFADGWGVSFLSSVYSLERADASLVNSWILFGLCLGSTLIPYLAETTKAYYETTFICALVMLFAFVLLISPLGIGNLGFYSLIALFICIGVASSYQVVVLSKISLYVEEKVSGVATAFANMIFMAFGSLFHMVIGFGMESLWDGTSDPSGVPIYSSKAFVETLSVIPFSVALGALGFFFLVWKGYFRKKKN